VPGAASAVAIWAELPPAPRAASPLVQNCHGTVIGALRGGQRVRLSGKRQPHRGVAMQHLEPHRRTLLLDVSAFFVDTPGGRR
jgi:hypothetical protein